MRQYFPHNFIIFKEQVRNEWTGQVEHLSNELSVKLSLQVIILSRIFTLNIYGGWFSIHFIVSWLFIAFFFFPFFLGRCLHIRIKRMWMQFWLKLDWKQASVFVLTGFKQFVNWDIWIVCIDSSFRVFICFFFQF